MWSRTSLSLSLGAPLLVSSAMTSPPRSPLQRNHDPDWPDLEPARHEPEQPPADRREVEAGRAPRIAGPARDDEARLRQCDGEAAAGVVLGPEEKDCALGRERDADGLRDELDGRPRPPEAARQNPAAP